MITVKRANTVLDIPDDCKDKYMKEGYSIIDAVTGIVLEQSEPIDLAGLKLALHKANSLVESLKGTVEKLNIQLTTKDEEIKKLKSSITKLKKTT